MIWQKVTLQFPAEHITTVEEILEELGASAISLESANTEELFEPELGTTPLWQATQISALFEENADLASILLTFKQQIAEHIPTHHVKIVTEQLAEQNWQQLHQDAFPPLLFADRLWVYPSWHPKPADGKPYIELDPGLAFGTGTHPTTALCLEWLAQHGAAFPTVVDYGCGSGILAIAAVKLGAQKVYAVDNDPQALEATHENANRNGISTQQLTTFLPETLPSLKSELIIANILANPLIQLAPRLLKLLAPQGKIVLSGLLSTQADSVMAAYQPSIQFTQTKIQEDWVLLQGTRTS
ncbi:MAG: 50S ribosomal protein L11 methyltransferase [Gammaproteobacteria bacterium]